MVLSKHFFTALILAAICTSTASAGEKASANTQRTPGFALDAPAGFKPTKCGDNDPNHLHLVNEPNRVSITTTWFAKKKTLKEFQESCAFMLKGHPADFYKPLSAMESIQSPTASGYLREYEGIEPGGGPVKRVAKVSACWRVGESMLMLHVQTTPEELKRGRKEYRDMLLSIRKSTSINK
jgi:hypothetical protein